MSFTEHFDYIVVGGGSSGCIVAARLAAANIGSILLVEAGDPSESNPDTLSADSFVQAYSNDRTMIDRLSTPQVNCDHRRRYVGTGTGMGGSGAVNGMVYTRGDRRDFDQWPEGWHWQDVCEAFEGLEATLRVRSRPATDFTDMCIDAAVQAGFQRKDTLNDGDLCGFFGYQLMNYEGDRRRNSYVSFIKGQQPANLTLRTNTRVQRIVFDNHKRAVGLELKTAEGPLLIGINRELILCAGALETPKLLMLSGVGPAQHLTAMGIDTVADCPQIGRNLQDHPNVCLFYRGKPGPEVYYPQIYGFDRMNPQLPLPAQQADTCFVFFSSSASIQETMKRMLPAMMLTPGGYKKRWIHRLLRRLIDAVFAIPGVRKFTSEIFGVVIILGKPLSRGTVTLASTDPQEPLAIDLNYLANAADTDTLTAGVLHAQTLVEQAPFVAWGNKPLSKVAKTQDRSVIGKWLKQAANTTYHFSGTCRMGTDDAAPVDTELALKQVANIRIADASVIPEVPVAALNAPSMMIGWRAADFIINNGK